MSANVATLYRVAAGDSLSKIAQKFYGDANLYPEIARANNINPQSILYIGQPLHLPALKNADELEEVQVTAQRLPIATSAPASPGGSVVDPATGIEAVTVSAYVWWKDWRWYAGGAALVALLWYTGAFKGRR